MIKKIYKTNKIRKFKFKITMVIFPKENSDRRCVVLGSKWPFYVHLVDIEFIFYSYFILIIFVNYLVCVRSIIEPYYHFLILIIDLLLL